MAKISSVAWKLAELQGLKTFMMKKFLKTSRSHRNLGAAPKIVTDPAPPRYANSKMTKISSVAWKLTEVQGLKTLITFFFSFRLFPTKAKNTNEEPLWKYLQIAILCFFYAPDFSDSLFQMVNFGT